MLTQIPESDKENEEKVAKTSLILPEQSPTFREQTIPGENMFDVSLGSRSSSEETMLLPPEFKKINAPKKPPRLKTQFNFEEESFLKKLITHIVCAKNRLSVAELVLAAVCITVGTLALCSIFPMALAACCAFGAAAVTLGFCAALDSIRSLWKSYKATPQASKPRSSYAKIHENVPFKATITIDIDSQKITTTINKLSSNKPRYKSRFFREREVSKTKKTSQQKRSPAKNFV